MAKPSSWPMGQDDSYKPLERREGDQLGLLGAIRGFGALLGRLGSPCLGSNGLHESIFYGSCVRSSVHVRM